MCIKLDGRGDGQWTVQYSFVIEFQCFIKLNITLFLRSCAHVEGS